MYNFLLQVVRLHKSQTCRAWEDLCMAMLGEQFMVGSELCGVVLSVRFQVSYLTLELYIIMKTPLKFYLVQNYIG